MNVTTDAYKTIMLGNKCKIQNVARTWISLILLIACDIVILFTSLELSIFFRKTILPLIYPYFPIWALPPHFYLRFCWIPAILVFFFSLYKLYSRRFPFWTEVIQIWKADTFAVLSILAVVSLAKLSNEISRTVLVLNWLFTLALAPLGRYWFKNLLFLLGIWKRNLLILGDGATAKRAIHAIEKEPILGYEVIGFLDDTLAVGGIIETIKGKPIKVIGRLCDATSVIPSFRIQDVILANPHLTRRQLVELSSELQMQVDNVKIIPDLFGLPVLNSELEHFFGEQAFILNIKNNLSKPWNIFLKRVFDIVIATFGLILASPLILVTALAIKVNSPGPSLYLHNRIGRRKKPVRVFKFRSMVRDADKALQDLLTKDPQLKEEFEREFKLKNDPRITKVGKALRKTSLDELPQFINVLLGQISLVGPRPIVEAEVKKYGKYADYYFSVKPGITGLWQVSGRNDVDYATRVSFDLWYVRNWSIWLDIIILLKTVHMVLCKKGAY